MTAESIKGMWQYYFGKYRKLFKIINMSRGYGETDADE
jgi:hypothetical protein